jgi:hypothetical protein
MSLYPSSASPDVNMSLSQGAGVKTKKPTWAWCCFLHSYFTCFSTMSSISSGSKGGYHNVRSKIPVVMYQFGKVKSFANRSGVGQAVGKQAPTYMTSKWKAVWSTSLTPIACDPQVSSGNYPTVILAQGHQYD